MVIASCSRDDLASQPAGPLSQSSVSTAPIATSGLHEASEFRERLSRAREATRWVGEMHHRAMSELIRDRDLLMRGAVNREARTCAVALDLAKRHGAAEHWRVSHHVSEAELARATATALQANGRCTSLSAANVFARTTGTLPRGDTAVLSGHVDYYLDALYIAIDGWDGVSDLWADVDSILGGLHLPLTNDDMLLLGATLELAVSSHTDWLSVEWQNPAESVPWSIFRHREATRAMPRWLRSVIKVVLVDVVSFASTTAGFMIDGMEPNTAVTVGAYTGVASSAAAGLSCMLGEWPCAE